MINTADACNNVQNANNDDEDNVANSNEQASNKNDAADVDADAEVVDDAPADDVDNDNSGDDRLEAELLDDGVEFGNEMDDSINDIYGVVLWFETSWTIRRLIIQPTTRRSECRGD